MAASDRFTAHDAARLLNRFGPEGFNEDVRQLFEDYFASRSEEDLSDSDGGDDTEQTDAGLSHSFLQIMVRQWLHSLCLPLLYSLAPKSPEEVSLLASARLD